MLESVYKLWHKGIHSRPSMCTTKIITSIWNNFLFETILVFFIMLPSLTATLQTAHNVAFEIYILGERIEHTVPFRADTCKHCNHIGVGSHSMPFTTLKYVQRLQYALQIYQYEYIVYHCVYIGMFIEFSWSECRNWLHIQCKMNTKKQPSEMPKCSFYSCLSRQSILVLEKLRNHKLFDGSTLFYHCLHSTIHKRNI